MGCLLGYLAVGMEQRLVFFEVKAVQAVAAGKDEGVILSQQINISKRQVGIGGSLSKGQPYDSARDEVGDGSRLGRQSLDGEVGADLAGQGVKVPLLDDAVHRGRHEELHGTR